jgi:hypothetical protein
MLPFTWWHLYYPYFPIAFYETLDALMPYIAGIEKKHYKFVEKTIGFKDKVIVDLDSDTVLNEEEDEIVVLPVKAKVYLIDQLEKL